MDDEIEEAVDAFRAGVDRLLKPSNETRRVGPENYDVEEAFEVDLVRIGEAVSGPDEAKEVSPWYLVCEVATPVNVPSKHWGKFIDRIEESEDYKVMYAPFKDVTNPHRLPDSAKGLIVRDVE